MKDKKTRLLGEICEDIQWDNYPRTDEETGEVLPGYWKISDVLYSQVLCVIDHLKTLNTLEDEDNDDHIAHLENVNKFLEAFAKDSAAIEKREGWDL